jgi:hypothetical protein
MCAGSCRCQPSGEDDLCRSTHFLRWPLGSIGDVIHATYNAHSKLQCPSSPSYYALVDFFLLGITMIVRPRHWRSDSPYPWPILVPMGGTPRPPRGRIPPCPFQGGLKLFPDPVRHLSSTPTIVLVAVIIIIIVVVDGNPASTSSSRVG